MKSILDDNELIIYNISGY